MRSTGDFLDWISWRKEGEDFAGLEEVFGGEKKRERKKEFSARAERKYRRKKNIYDFSDVGKFQVAKST
jgi:hypothetical protein